MFLSEPNKFIGKEMPNPVSLAILSYPKIEKNLKSYYESHCESLSVGVQVFDN